jgi:predicted PurR-regulated permease PerM
MHPDLSPPPTPTEGRPRQRLFQSDNFRRFFLLALLITITVIFLNMIKIFFQPALLAAVFVTLFYPFYRKLTQFFRGRRAISSMVCCMILLIGLLTPIYGIGYLVTKEAPNFYNSLRERLTEITQKGESGILGRITSASWFKRSGLDQLDWPAAIQDLAAKTGTLAATVIRKTSGGAIQVVVSLFVMLFIMFYFFKDGELLLEKVKYLIPLDEQHKEAIITRFISVSRASIRGTIFIGLIQSAVGGLTLWVFGVGSPLLWAVVMAVLSLIPMLGAWLVMHSAVVVQVLMGNIWQAVGIFIITVLVVSTIDNVLRPRLVGQIAKMHELIIFFSAIGGISTFGPMGFIVGPVIAAFFIAIIDIYAVEFKTQLDDAQKGPLSI